MPSRQSNPSPQRAGLFSKGRAPHSRSNAHSVRSAWPYSKAVLLWFSANIFLLSAVASVGYGVKMKQNDFVIYGLIGVGVFLFFKVCFILASKATPCPLCRANHLANSRSSKHKDAYKILFLSYSSSAVLTSFFRGCVRCMHCGVTFSLKKKRK